jgi:hypothetical protein
MVMNKFESTLSSALHAEADRTTLQLRTADAAHRLDARFDQIDRDRRGRTWGAALTAAAAAVLVAGTVYGVMKIQPGTTHEPIGNPTTPSATLPTTTSQYPGTGTYSSVTPGTYEYRVNPDNSIWPIHAAFTLYVPWKGGIPPQYVSETGSRGGLDLYQPFALAGGNGCLATATGQGAQPDTSVGHTARALAQQLAHLPHSAVLQAAASEHMFGTNGFHLRLQINDDCRSGMYGVAKRDTINWTTLQLGRGIGADGDTHILIDFWVQDVHGAPTVVETWHQDDAPAQMVDQITKTRDSIRFLRG